MSTETCSVHEKYVYIGLGHFHFLVASFGCIFPVFASWRVDIGCLRETAWLVTEPREVQIQMPMTYGCHSPPFPMQRWGGGRVLRVSFFPVKLARPVFEPYRVHKTILRRLPLSGRQNEHFSGVPANEQLNLLGLLDTSETAKERERERAGTGKDWRRTHEGSKNHLLKKICSTLRVQNG